MIGEILTSQFVKKRSNIYFHQKLLPLIFRKSFVKQSAEARRFVQRGMACSPNNACASAFCVLEPYEGLATEFALTRITLLHQLQIATRLSVGRAMRKRFCIIGH